MQFSRDEASLAKLNELLADDSVQAEGGPIQIGNVLHQKATLSGRALTLEQFRGLDHWHFVQKKKDTP